MNSEHRYRKCAAEVRQQAAETKDDELRLQLEMMAGDYDALASAAADAALLWGRPHKLR